jgi:hypothetical protein
MFFGEGDEVFRQDEAQMRVLPPGENLKSGQATGPEGD